MSQKTALLAAILIWVAAPAATAEESGANKPVKKASHTEEKADTPVEEHKLDYKELFGCEPMGEEGHKSMLKPASRAGQQGAMPSAQENEPMQEKR